MLDEVAFFISEYVSVHPGLQSVPYSAMLTCAGFAINFISACIIIRGIYYQKEKDYSFIFTFMVFNTVIYFIMCLFTSVELSIGVGFGLFALFSVLRYRTETVPIREMTYLFVMVALPLINSVYFGSRSYLSLFIANASIIAVIWFMEKEQGFSYEGRLQVTYEDIELIHPSRKEELYADLYARTGKEITRCDIVHVNYVQDVADLVIHYKR